MSTEEQDRAGEEAAVKRAAQVEHDLTLTQQISALIDFTRHIRIGETADGDFFVQVIELMPPHEDDGSGPVGETILASSEGLLGTCLRNVAATIEHLGEGLQNEE